MKQAIYAGLLAIIYLIATTALAAQINEAFVLDLRAKADRP